MAERPTPVGKTVVYAGPTDSPRASAVFGPLSVMTLKANSSLPDPN